MNMPGSFAKFVVTSALLLAFVAIGYVAGQRGYTPALESQAHASGLPSFIESASGGNQLSMATGRIEDGIEAIFGLDHLTGDLFCWVLNPTSGELATTFRLNVAGVLNVEGDADYVMVTGLMDFRISRSNGRRISDSVVYIGDGNSGNVAAFSLVYDGSAVSRGDIAAGELRPISSMLTRDPNSIRDQGR